jgi:hypothetical protein
LANRWEDLSEKIINVFFGDDGGERRGMQVGEKIYDFFEDRESLILEWDRVHVGGGYLFIPLLFGNIDKRILYHIIMRLM